MSAVVFAAFFVYAGLLVVAGQLGTRRVEAALAKRTRGPPQPRAGPRAPRPGHADRGRPAPLDERPRRVPRQAGVRDLRGRRRAPAGRAVPPDGAARLRPPRDLEKETGNVIRLLGAVKVKEETVDVPKGGVRFSLDTGGRQKGRQPLAGRRFGGRGRDRRRNGRAPGGLGAVERTLERVSPVPARERLRRGNRPAPRKAAGPLSRPHVPRTGSVGAVRDVTVAGSEHVPMSRVVLAVVGGLGIATLVVFFLASLVAGLLVYRIARATRRLSTGFGEIEKGNFGHRALLKGHDQLAALVGSFNHMAERLAASVAARAEKEALERELEVARDLQRRPPAGGLLLPRRLDRRRLPAGGRDRRRLLRPVGRREDADRRRCGRLRPRASDRHRDGGLEGGALGPREDRRPGTRSWSFSTSRSSARRIRGRS